ncbi:MAG: thermonuclease family protein [Burkholderiales bacterium]|nr:MAG: thermonuclease family protein [Burkholderiales bacterium]
MRLVKFPDSRRPPALMRAAAAGLLALSTAVLPACGNEPGERPAIAASGPARASDAPQHTDAGPRTASAPRLAGRVEKVFDGDSFRMRLADGTVTGVRIGGIDAPERTQPFAGVSRRTLANRIEGSTVEVEARKRDPYGRVVGAVFRDGQDLGLAQIEAGLAWHFRRYAHEQPPQERRSYAEAEARARAARRGLWSHGTPQPPWEFRARRRANDR